MQGTTINSAADTCLDQSLVSIVIPCFKQASFLPTAIKSALAQTHRHVEIIVVDDGSPDDVYATTSDLPAVKFITQQNRGPSAARNAGWRASSGEFVVFLDADDWLMPNALEHGLQGFGDDPACAMVFGRCEMRFENSQYCLEQPKITQKNPYLAILENVEIWHPAAMICRRSVLEAGYEFDENMRLAEDFDLYLRIARSLPVRGHNMIVSCYLQHENNETNNAAAVTSARLEVLNRQHLVEVNELRSYKLGVRNARDICAHRSINDFLSSRQRVSIETLREVVSLVKRYPRVLWGRALDKFKSLILRAGSPTLRLF